MTRHQRTTLPLRVCVFAGGPFNLMSRRVLAGTKLIVPQVAAIIAGCPTSAYEPQPML